MNQILQYGHFYEAAIQQSTFGLRVYPVVPFQKRPAIASMDRWIKNFSVQHQSLLVT